MEPTRKETALRALREKIASGELAPGERLSDFSQSRLMGISRTPVREAINMLVAEGLAVAHPHAGVFVASPGPDDLRELYELREALEGFAAACLAERGARPILQALQDCRKAARERLAGLPRTGMLDPEQRKELRELDRRFHALVVDGSGNARIRRAMDDAAIHARLFATMTDDVDVTVPRSAWRMHDAVIKAIKAGDPEGARAAMAAHIRRGRERRLAAWQEAENAR